MAPSTSTQLCITSMMSTLHLHASEAAETNNLTFVCQNAWDPSILTTVSIATRAQAYPNATFSARMRTVSTNALAMLNTIAVTHAECTSGSAATSATTAV